MHAKCYFLKKFDAVLWTPIKLSLKGASSMPFERQQSFDHYLHACWHIRHRSFASWSRRRLCEFATSLTWCPARRSAETFNRLSLCGDILKYTTITNLFFDDAVTEIQRIVWVKQMPDNNCRTTRIETKYFVQFLRSTRYKICFILLCIDTVMDYCLVHAVHKRAYIYIY